MTAQGLAQPGLFAEPKPRYKPYDPRPDLKKDHAAWQKLLAAAYDHDRNAYYVLYGMRCLGAEIISPVPGTLRVTAGQMAAATWAELRAKMMEPLRDPITRIVRSTEPAGEITREEMDRQNPFND